MRCHPGRPSSDDRRQNLDLNSQLRFGDPSVPLPSAMSRHVRFGVADIPDVEHDVVQCPRVEDLVLVICSDQIRHRCVQSKPGSGITYSS
jgi:hypothetical protein